MQMKIAKIYFIHVQYVLLGLRTECCIKQHLFLLLLPDKEQPKVVTYPVCPRICRTIPQNNWLSQIRGLLK